MSQELIDAVVKGDRNRVVELLTKRTVNVNDLGKFDRAGIFPHHSGHGDLVRGTALTAAVIHKQHEIALLLLAHGAVDVKNDGAENSNYFRDLVFVNPIVHTPTIAMDLKLLRALLARTRDFNPLILYRDNGRQEYLINEFKYHGACKLEDRVARFRMFFCEAVLRNAMSTVNACTTWNEPGFGHNKDFVINRDMFVDYLDGRKFTAEQAREANCGFDYLVANRHLNVEDAAHCKALVNANICENEVFKIQFAQLPKLLQDALAGPPPRQLLELFAELQAWLNPEAELPHIHVDSETFKKFAPEKNAKSTAEIRDWQNPKNLRKFLDLDVLPALIRLSNCSSESGENPAAVLLGEILLRYSDYKCDDDKPLLDQRQQTACLVLLDRFYNMTAMDKMYLNTHREQTIALTELRQQNEELSGELKSLHGKLDLLLKAAVPGEKRARESMVADSSRIFGKRPR